MSEFAAPRIYNSRDVNVIVNGEVVTGFALSSIVSLGRANDRVTPYTGVKNETTVAINNNTAGTITVNLQQSSPFNAKFQELANANQFFNISVIDRNDAGFIAGGNYAVIQIEPTTERGAEVTEMAWQIFVADYTITRVE